MNPETLKHLIIYRRKITVNIIAQICVAALSLGMSVFFQKMWIGLMGIGVVFLIYIISLGIEEQ